MFYILLNISVKEVFFKFLSKLGSLEGVELDKGVRGVGDGWVGGGKRLRG